MEVGALLLLLRLKTWVMTLPAPQYKVGPLFCFCSIVIEQKTYYEMDFKTNLFFPSQNGWTLVFFCLPAYILKLK